MEMKVRKMAGHLIRRLNQVSTHLFSSHMHERGFDLTSVQFAAMDAIQTHNEHNNDKIDQAGVAAMIAYDRNTIGGVIDRLVQKGYVKRTISKRDKRARELNLTQAGEKIFEEILPVVTALQKEITGGLTKAEQTTFLKLANKALNNLPENALPESAK